MKKTTKTAMLLAALTILSACSNAAPPAASSAGATSSPPAQSLPEPEPEPEPEIDNSWKFDAPENHGMDPEVLARMHEALSGADVHVVVTVKDGVIIDEFYQEGWDETSVFALNSCSKSFTSALVGIAVGRGELGGVDDLLSDYLPRVGEFTDGRQNLTLAHLLTHTSGLEWYEWGGGASNWGEFQSAPNWVEYILGRNLAAQPGAVFNYSTGNTHLLTAALEAAAGMGGLDYAREHLFGPLGMESVRWRTDPQGICDGGNGISMTARDAARFGQLYLNGGVWNNEQMIPADWVEESTSPQNSGAGDGTGSYGYGWWTRSFQGYDTYYAFGAFGQYILVVPELDLVTVIASPGPQSSYAPRAYFTDYVLAACRG